VARDRPVQATGQLFSFGPVYAGPPLVATALLAWLARRSPNPAAAFIKLAALVLLLSFIPDYTLPVPHRTLLASSVAASLHVIAALIITAGILAGYRRTGLRGAK